MAAFLVGDETGPPKQSLDGAPNDCDARASPSLQKRGGAPSPHEPFFGSLRPAIVSGGFGVNRTFFERNIHLVAERGQGFADGASWKLKDGSGEDANCGQAPGLEVLFNVDDDPFPVKVYG